MKTKAETAFAEQFAAHSGALPEGPASHDERRAAMERFDALGLPHRRIEAWKYTDLRNALGAVGAPANGSATHVEAADLQAALGQLGDLDVHRVVFLDGRLDEALSSVPANVGLAPITTGLPSDPQLSDESIVALNTAFVTDGVEINVTDGVAVDKPLMIVSVRTGDDDKLVTLRHAVSVGRGAKLTLIETAVSLGSAAGQANGLSTVKVSDGATLEHIKIGTSAPVTDLSTWRVCLDSEAQYRAVQLIPGSPLARNQVFVTFEGEASSLDFASAVLGNGRDHIDSTIVVHHVARGCTSRELYKGVLDGAARGVCQGKVVVQREAQKTDGKQMAQALMLSETCEFDSKPELEIYADDVACGHGSTSARIDPDLIFYCRSRGISEETAKVLLTESFVAEAIDKVENAALREAMADIARRWLGANNAAP